MLRHPFRGAQHAFAVEADAMKQQRTALPSIDHGEAFFMSERTYRETDGRFSFLAGLTPGASDFDTLEATLLHGSQSQISSALAKLSPDHAKTIEGALHGAFDHAFSGVMMMMAGVCLFGAVLCFMLIRKKA